MLAGATRTPTVLAGSEKFSDAMDPAEVAAGALDHLGKGPNWVPGAANHAIAQAFHMVRSGVASAAIAGGTEACLTLGVIRAWEAMRVLADDTCRPFSKQRRGLVLDL